MTNDINWLDICDVSDLVEDSGVCALVDEKQVALFYIPAETKVYALSQYDPFGQANILSRGLIGSKEGRLYVASPLYKQRFYLETGECLEDEKVSLPTWKAQLVDNRVMIQAL